MEELRRIAPEEAASSPALTKYVGQRRDLIVIVRERDGVLRCAGVLDPKGCTTEPDDPAARVVVVHEDASLEEDVRPVVEALIEAARESEARRVVIGWDAMDARGLRMLEDLGFATTGRMAYFETGPGQVDYVDGYQDATGSTVDLAMDLA
jgi:hypothetical protein